ncbi:MAG: nucleoside/nucleotide kinase family protein [Ilumatobacteraceae bacterium]
MATGNEAMIERVDAMLRRGGRVLGIAGPPGAGKSTVAERLLLHYGTRAALLPMDGFHFANEELHRLGLAHRKGAPDTFDVEGYLAALGRVRGREHDVLVPRFHREIEEPVANAIRIDVDADLVITEGNYLLLGAGRWGDVAALLDERWLLRPDEVVRRARLVARHEAHGRSATEARSWVDEVDQPNAELVLGRSIRATWELDPG